MAIVVPWQAKAEVTADTFLTEHGVPADVIEQMTDLQKEYLCEMLPDNAKFESYSSQKYMMADDDSLVATYGQISASDLTMSVVAFSNGNFSVSFSISIGVGQVSITPNRADDVDTMAGVFPF